MAIKAAVGTVSDEGGICSGGLRSEVDLKSRFRSGAEKTRLEIGEVLLRIAAIGAGWVENGGVKQRNCRVTVHCWPLRGSEPAEAVTWIVYRAPMRFLGTSQGGERDGSVWTAQRAGSGQGGCDKGT